MENIPEEKRGRSDYAPSSGEYLLEQMTQVTQDPAAIRDILEKIKDGTYEVLFIPDEEGNIIEEKVRDKSGKFVWYNDIKKQARQC